VLSAFYKIVGAIYSKKTANIVESTELEQIRDSLLPKLLSGEISVEKNLYTVTGKEQSCPSS
jgi:type I restriction enzyme S subunit